MGTGKRLRDKRRNSRRAAEWQVLVGEVGCGRLRARGRTVDASPGGLGLLCDEAIRVGEEVRLLVVAGRRIARLAGRVARCRCLGDGEFLHGVILSEPGRPGHDLLAGGAGERTAAPGENLC